MNRFKLSLFFVFLASLTALAVLASCSETTTTEDQDDDEDGDEVEDGDFEMPDMDGDDDAEINVVIDGDETADGDKPDGDAADGDATDGDETDGDFADGDLESPETDTEAYRVTQLLIVNPDTLEAYGVDVKALLESQLESRIAKYEINMLLDPVVDDVLDFPYEMRFMIGEKVGADYVVDPDESYTLDVIAGNSANEFTTDKGTEIAIPIGDGPNEVFIIREAVVSGIYSGDRIINGAIAGAVSEDDANSIEVYQGFTLSAVFLLLGMTPDYTFEDGSKGFTFIFTFEAEGVSFTEQQR